MKIIYKMKAMLMFLIVVLCSFTKNEFLNDELQIEILNTEILSRIDINPKHRSNLTRFDNYIYDSLPVNKINIRIFNNGKNTYVLFLNKDLNEIMSIETETIKMKVFKGNDLFEAKLLPILVQATGKGFISRKRENERNSDSLKMELNEKYLKEKVDIDKVKFQREMNYVIIHPGESKFFSFYKTLPVFIEGFYEFYRYDFLANENYTFQMTLSNDPKKLKKHLTINQLKEIEVNKYTFFDGVIASNKIPVKLVPISQKQ